jgi:hypothetical protein
MVDYAADRFVDAIDRRFSCSACSIATVRILSNFGALAERFYKENIQLQVLKTFREENDEVRELRRARGVT